MTNKQKELVKEITTEFKALPFKERMNIVADGTIGVVDSFLRQYPERQDEVDELLELDADVEFKLEDDYTASHEVYDEDELDELRDANEDCWINKVCAAELNLYAAFMNDEEGDVTEEECEEAGATLNDYMDWIRDASGCGLEAEDYED